MNPDLDTLATALYVTIDDLLVAHPQWAPPRPAVGIAPELSDAELVSLAVLQALLGFDSEARFVRYAKAHLTPWFPYVPPRPGYNKRLRRSGELIKHVMACLARACASWHDDVWLVDSTPVECGRSRETQKRSERPGWATYGYSASHSRYFWGLRLHLITTPSGLPITFALAGAKADERDVCWDMIARAGVARRGQTLIAEATAAPPSKPNSTTRASPSSDPPPKQNPPERAGSSCGRSARSSNRSTRPSKPNSASNATAGAPPPASPRASYNDSSPSPPQSGTTKPPNNQAPPAPCSPTTTDPLELII